MVFFKTMMAVAALALTTSGAVATTVDRASVGLQVTATGGGAYDGLTAFGGLTWDASLVPDDGWFLLSRAGRHGSTSDSTLSLFFDVGPVDPLTGQPLYRFTEADHDIGPLLTFTGGRLRSISYLVNSMSPFGLGAYGINLFTFDTIDPVGFDQETVLVNAIVKYLPVAPAPSVVPLPAGLPLLLGALGLLAFVRRRAV
jgi:hypothetical protein